MVGKSESDGMYRAVIEALADGIVLLEPEGTVIDCNPGAESILGVSCEAMLGNKFTGIGLDFVQENGASYPKKRLPHAITLATGKTCRNVVMGLSRPDSDTTWIRVDSEVLSSGGHPFAILVSFSDISLRKKHQEELQHSYSALRELSFRLQHAREVERASVAREIHDELGSALTSIKFDLSWAAEKLDGKGQFEEIFKALDAAIQSVKKICSDLRPPILDDLGLLAAIEWQLGKFGRKTGIRCKIEAKGSEPAVPQDVATGIFRIFQETLTNIARHADAANVRVRFQANEKDILLTVSDDGKGIDPKRSAGSKSLGILGMVERAQALGGALAVHPAKPRGTKVELSIPLERRTSRRAIASSIP